MLAKTFGVRSLDATPIFSLFFAHTRTCNNLLGNFQRKEQSLWLRISVLFSFADQGIRNIKDTIKRGDAATAEAEKMGMKIIEEFWTMGAYDGGSRIRRA